MNILPIEFNHEVETLLISEELPASDLLHSNQVKLFGFRLNEKLVGVVGLEHYTDVGLLRSLVVSSDLRGTGCGKNLVAAAESWAFENGVIDLYLLTTTVKEFFSKLGYKQLAREQAPASITGTSQFSGLCPSSAIFMCKRLH